MAAPTLNVSYGGWILDALDRVTKAYRQIVEREIAARGDEMLKAGEETLYQWRLQPHGRGAWRLVAPENIFLAWRDLSILGVIAEEHDLRLVVSDGVYLEARAGE